MRDFFAEMKTAFPLEDSIHTEVGKRYKICNVFLVESNISDIEWLSAEEEPKPETEPDKLTTE